MIDAVIDYLRTVERPVSTRHLATKFMVDHMDLFNALNVAASGNRLERRMVLEPGTGFRDLLCIGWACPSDSISSD